MKKIIVTVVAIGAATISAYAQSPGVEARMMADCWSSKKTSNQTAYTKKAPKVSTANTKALDRAVKQAAVRAAYDAQKATAATEKADSTTQKAPVQKADSTKKTASKKPVAKAKTKSKEGSFWAALFGGKYPGESDKDYAYRLRMQSYPACQPFK